MPTIEKDIWLSPLNAPEVNEAPIKNVKLKNSTTMTTEEWDELTPEQREGFWMQSFWVRSIIDELSGKLTPVFLSDQPRNYMTKAMKG